MADGIGGVGGSKRDDEVCGRDVSSSETIDVSNRTQVAKYLARLETLDPAASPVEYAWLKAQEPALRARAFKDTIPLGAEILRLRREPMAPNERIAQLADQWCAMARSLGHPPPTASFDPYAASDDELRWAHGWILIGGTLPVAAAMTDGGARFRDDVFAAAALRTPGFGEALIAAYADNPGAQRVLLEREVKRLGGAKQCRGDESIDDLKSLRARLLIASQATAPDTRLHIGLDGKVGTFDALVDYEFQQRAIAMNPSTSGAVVAGIVAKAGGTTTTIRASGALATGVEGVASGVAGVDRRALSKKAGQ
jgi:hypothetical protein